MDVEKYITPVNFVKIITKQELLKKIKIVKKENKRSCKNSPDVIYKYKDGKLHGKHVIYRNNEFSKYQVYKDGKLIKDEFGYIYNRIYYKLRDEDSKLIYKVEYTDNLDCVIL